MTASRTISVGLLIAIACTLAALARLAAFRPYPSPPGQISARLEKNLTQEGWHQNETISPVRMETLTSAEGIHYSLQKDDHNISQIELKITPIGARGFRYLGSEQIRKELWGKSTGQDSTRNLNGSTVLLKTGKGESSISTCITQGKASSQSNALAKLLRAEDITAVDRLKIIAGIRAPRRWHCLFVHLTAKNHSDNNAAALKIWEQISPTLLRSDPNVIDSH